MNDFRGMVSDRQGDVWSPMSRLCFAFIERLRTKTRLDVSLAIMAGWWLLAGCRSVEISRVTAAGSPVPTPAAGTELTADPLPPSQPADQIVTVEPTALSLPAMPWWNDAIFYEVFVRSFQDSDGDGIGDLQGLISKLDYLNDGDPDSHDDLGVTGLWLMPVTESPSYHGYDVVDYYRVDSEYGNNEDFLRLVDEAHARGIRIIVDLVMNHTSRNHPWFLDASDPDSARRAWYVWVDEPPGYRGPWGEVVWHKGQVGYYYGVFEAGMPDLNYLNVEVTEAMRDVVRFWLQEMGVDGFRLDAIKHLIEIGTALENTKETHEWLQGFYDFYKDLNPSALAVGEALTSTRQVVAYTGDEVDIAFAFDLALDILNSSDVGIGAMVADSQREMVESFAPGQYATFITNHDQDRVMSRLNGDEGAARVAATILLTSPGVPFVYYGEELGMQGKKPDEDIRLPMQWDSRSPGAGFTEGTPWRLPADDFGQRNVASQQDDPNSMLSSYRALILLRNTHPALRTGQWIQVQSDPARVYAFLRQSESETLLILLNLSRRAVEDYSLTVAEAALEGEVTAALLFGQGELADPETNASGGFENYRPLITLPPQSSFVIQLSSGSD